MPERPSNPESALRLQRIVPGSIGIVWLEQSHFVFKTPSGLLVHVDPFLSRTVKPEEHIHPRPFLEPDRAPADVVFLTHDHRDHTDPDTLLPMAQASPACRFVCTRESCERLAALGIDTAQLAAVAEGETVSIGGCTATAVHAENTSDHDQTTHLGFVFCFDGIRVYHAGDTRRDPDSYIARLEPVQRLSPQVLLVAINEGYNNPGLAGAVRLAEFTNPWVVIPCHYDCFVHNTADPAAFVRALPPRLRPAVRVLDHGEFYVPALSASA